LTGLLNNACESVFITINSTSEIVSDSNIRFTAFDPPPPTPTTLIIADPPIADADGAAGAGVGTAPAPRPGDGSSPALARTTTESHRDVTSTPPPKRLLKSAGEEEPARKGYTRLPWPDSDWALSTFLRLLVARALVTVRCIVTVYNFLYKEDRVEGPARFARGRDDEATPGPGDGG